MDSSVLKSPAAEDEDVHPTVVVAVDEGAAGRHGFDDIGKTIQFAAHGRLSQTGRMGHVYKTRKGREGFFDTGAAPSLLETKELRTAAGMVRSSSRRVREPNVFLLMTATILRNRRCRPG